DNVPDTAWSAFESAGAAIRTAQSKGSLLIEEGDGHNIIQKYEDNVHNAKIASDALSAAIEQVRTYAPDFLQPIGLSSIKALIQDACTVLVAFCITEQGSIGFVVGNHHEQDITTVEIPTFTRTALRSIIGKWHANDRVADEWPDTITKTLAELGQ